MTSQIIMTMISGVYKHLHVTQNNRSQSHFVLPDDVPANNTIWILGDQLLTEAANHYSFFKGKRVVDPATNDANALYMESMYAIKLIPSGMYTTNQAANMPNIILDALVDTLNQKAKVPHTLIIVINDYRFWNNADLLQYQMDRIIARFIKEIKRIAEARNLSLPPRAVNWDYPRIFITRALPLPNNMDRPYPRGFKANRRRYNRTLLRGESELGYRSINLPEFICDNSNHLFMTNGSLTAKGFRSFWTSISDAVHKADNQDRIMLNKVRAKQLAAQIAVTSQELKELNNSQQINTFSDLSDVEPMENQKPDSKPTKRALINDFNKQTDGILYGNSPASQISEYFTAQHRLHAAGARQVIHHKPNTFNNLEKRRWKKKHHNKNNWRHNNRHQQWQ